MMSQGIIIRDRLEEPSEMDEFQTGYDCSCGAKFEIYQHRAHPEDAAEKLSWLESVLETDHRRSTPHASTYQYSTRV